MRSEVSIFRLAYTVGLALRQAWHNACFFSYVHSSTPFEPTSTGCWHQYACQATKNWHRICGIRPGWYLTYRYHAQRSTRSAETSKLFSQVHRLLIASRQCATTASTWFAHYGWPSMLALTSQTCVGNIMFSAYEVVTGPPVSKRFFSLPAAIYHQGNHSQLIDVAQTTLYQSIKFCQAATPYHGRDLYRSSRVIQILLCCPTKHPLFALPCLCL